MKTYMGNQTNTASTPKEWYLVDAKEKILGRLASRVATVIRGKHKPTYTPNFDMGDNVVVINAKKIRVTGNKLKNKQYLNFSGYPGGLKSTSLEVMLEKKPEDVIKIAVRKMLPANPLSRQMLKKLKVYAGETHPYKKVNFLTIKID
jgi:large subunit ribosomal protein L13